MNLRQIRGRPTQHLVLLFQEAVTFDEFTNLGVFLSCHLGCEGQAALGPVCIGHPFRER